MAEVKFTYDSQDITIQCNKNKKFKDICNNLLKKIRQKRSKFSISTPLKIIKNIHLPFIYQYFSVIYNYISFVSNLYLMIKKYLFFSYIKSRKALILLIFAMTVLILLTTSTCSSFDSIYTTINIICITCIY